MGYKKKYFSSPQGSPLAISATGKRRVRFEEVDMLGIVWHGHYVSFLDDGRIAFGDKYGLSYNQMRNASVVAPIVQMHIDYFSPIYFDKEIEIEAKLHWTDALKLNFEYNLFCDDKVAARGYTVQLFVDLQGNTIYSTPQFIEDFRLKWKNGDFT